MRLFLIELAISALICWPAEAYFLPQQSIPADTLITLRRSQCFGECPDYTVSIAADGTVTFEGREFVKTKGVAKGSISPDSVRQLIAAFENAQFFSLRDSYQSAKDGCPEEWTDHPSAQTSLRLNGKTKSIYHYHGCMEEGGRITYPAVLTQLENRIDEIVGTKRWID